MAVAIRHRSQKSANFGLRRAASTLFSGPLTPAREEIASIDRLRIPAAKATPKNSQFGICDFTGIGCLADSLVRGERLYRDDDRQIIPARPV